eukprot:CAMPEP_0198145156 /NCGR_PEP_ID=MMETSP1443-20131203/21382_1 /TAXON_ID=186043 /ORGANISM="Entomoneis sp., Strain CCMP2396" /LENGTH=590 /DNA_ID=CAMNT_0043808711 /DNA_START=237 /DNA_END=2009 /DNA_ORIENTATION=+
MMMMMMQRPATTNTTTVGESSSVPSTAVDSAQVQTTTTSTPVQQADPASSSTLSLIKKRPVVSKTQDNDDDHRLSIKKVIALIIASIVLYVVAIRSICLPHGYHSYYHPLFRFITFPSDATITASGGQQHGRSLQAVPPHDGKQQKERVLYIVTTLAEYNTGSRKTVKGSDRLQETLIPVMSESVQTMLNAGYHVDVFLVCHYILRPERYQLVRDALPESVGLDFWNSATPLGYDTGKNPFTKLQNRTLHLARQHRFVIKDKLTKYDLFACFEDDMVIHGKQIEHFIAVTKELFRLRETAPDSIPLPDKVKADEHYHGPLTKSMLKRMIPGFIRVEVLLDEDKFPAQKSTGPVPIDLEFSSSSPGGKEEQVSPEYCCHVAPQTSNAHIPESPSADKLMLWETNVLPLGVRQMPENSWLDWVVMLRGPNQNKLEPNEVIGDYWSNRDRKYWSKDEAGGRRPAPQEFKYINNQGGWMATREQLWEWHTEICPGGFLPPYEAPHYRYDGLDMRNVEWYSGGMQLSTIRHACNMQRIIAIDHPANFSKSLLYHSANNKQQQLAGEGKREWFVKANTLLGQLNAIRKQASKDILR